MLMNLVSSSYFIVNCTIACHLKTTIRFLLASGKVIEFNNTESNTCGIIVLTASNNNVMLYKYKRSGSL